MKYKLEQNRNILEVILLSMGIIAFTWIMIIKLAQPNKDTHTHECRVESNIVKKGKK